MADIEPVATQLLDNAQTLYDGIELVPGRRVDARETDIVALALLSSSSRETFGLLLLQAGAEQIQK